MLSDDKLSASYSIQDQDVTMHKLTINKMNEMLTFISSLQIDKKEIEVKDVLQVLLGDKVKELMSILLNGNLNLIDWGAVEYDQIDEIIEDFFLLNPRLQKRLKSMFGYSI
jgi:Glu-tRNA(Gln) amidotransferase subunit E-like FAD-binding protein